MCGRSYICSGLATISFLPSTVWSIHLTRAKAVCSNQQLMEQKQKNCKKCRLKCKYPMWALNRVNIKNSFQPNPVNSNNNVNQQSNTVSNSNKKKSHLVVPYTKGLSEGFKNACGKHGIQVYFKGGKIYRCKCDWVDCDWVYWWIIKNMERGSRNIPMPPPAYLTIVTSQVMPQLWATSA